MARFPKTPSSTFVQRRARLAETLDAAIAGSLEHGSLHAQSAHQVCGAVLCAGWARPRNFAHSHFPFRAESHFLHLIGQHIEGAVLLLERDGRCRLFVPEPDPSQFVWTGPRPSLEEWARRLEVACFPLGQLASSLDGETWVTVPPQDDATASWLSSVVGRPIEAQGGAELEGIDALLAEALVKNRLVHDEPAVEQIRAAAQITVHAHRRAMRATRNAPTEARVRAELEAEFTAAGLTNAYPSIVTTRGEILHAERSDGALDAGDLILCDAGAESPEGWASDVTRTWPVSGRFSSTQRRILELVVSVQRAAIDGVTPGASFVDLHVQAQERLTAGLHDLGILRGGLHRCTERRLGAVFFPHGLGHLLGLDVHDMEDLGDRAGYGEEAERFSNPALELLRLARTLRADMVVTIEPGFYQVPRILEAARREPALSECIDWFVLERFSDVRGVRVEDDVRVMPQGAEVLSQGLPTHAREIEEWMRD